MANKKLKKTYSTPPQHPQAAMNSNQFKLVPTSPQTLNRNSNYKPKPCYKLRTCLRTFARTLCPSCCCRAPYHQHDVQRRKRGRIKETGCCPPWNCFPFCCCHGRRHRRPTTDSSEDICNLIRNCGTSQGNDIDIDQYVARYRQSEQLQLSATAAAAATSGQVVAPTSTHLPATTAPRTPSASQSTTPEVHKRGKKKLIKHIWNWNDSLKSNSDKFLESLEYDAVNCNDNGGGGGDGGTVCSKSNSLKKYRKIPNCSDIEGIKLDAVAI